MKRSNTDILLDKYLAGIPLSKIASSLGIEKSLVKSRLTALGTNFEHLADRYEPGQRVSRMGKPISQTEAFLISQCRENKISLKVIANLVQRDKSELGVTQDERNTIVDMRRVGVGVDLIQAYRYLYYCKGISVLSDQAYDALEKEEMEFGAHGGILKEAPSSDNPEDYRPHIRALALYLVFKYSEKEKDA